MKIKLDENLGRRGAELLVSEGHEVATVGQQGLSGCSDAMLIGVCRSEQRCLVTLDVEFGNPLVFSPDEHRGIAVLRLPRRSSAAALDAALETLARGLKEAEIDGKLWIVQRGRIRVYQQEREV